MFLNSINSILLFVTTLFNIGPVDQDIIERLLDYSWNVPQEKVYLHTDKTDYFPGEDIWYKAYLMIGPNHVPDSITEVLYVELINDKGVIINRQSLHIQDGLGWGDFMIPQASSPGKYILKAYTRYMMNFDEAFYYRKAINIISENQNVIGQSDTTNPLKPSNEGTTNKKPFSIEFFPEGGNMVEGIHNFVAFKSTIDGKKGIDVKGVLKSGEGEEILDFESEKFGMGLFSFTPERGKNYFAHIGLQGEEYVYALPESLEMGYTMHIKSSGDKIYIWARNNMGINMDNSFIIGQFRGFPFITIHSEPDHDFIYSVLSIKDIAGYITGNM